MFSSIMNYLANQARKPTGWFGRLVAPHILRPILTKYLPVIRSISGPILWKTPEKSNEYLNQMVNLPARSGISS